MNKKMTYKKTWLACALCIAALLAGCRPAKDMSQTRFYPDKVQLGMSRDAFVRRFGEPNMQNVYWKDGVQVEELLYVETLFYRKVGYRKVDSRFVFEDDKLVRREQGEDAGFQLEQELNGLRDALDED